MGKMGMGKEEMQGTGRDASVSTSLPKAKIQGAQVGFFLFLTLFLFFFFNNISPVIIFPVSKWVLVAASVTVINKVVVAGLLWDRWGSIWDLYVFQVEEAELYLHAEQRV